MPFVKGQSGNPGGRPKKGKTFTDILNANYSKEELVAAMWKRAVKDEDYQSQKYLMDRWEGTPTQTQKIDMAASLDIDTDFEMVEPEDFEPDTDLNTDSK